MWWKFLFATVLIFGSLAADEYEVDRELRQNRLFFAQDAARKAALLDRVKLLKSLSALDNLFVASTMPPTHSVADATAPKSMATGINELCLYYAERQKAKVIAANFSRTSLRQVALARQSGFKVCLMTVRNINDLVAALLKEPDYILCDAKLDLEKVREILNRPQKVVPFPPLADLNDPNECKLNYQSVAHRSEGTALRVMSYNILAQCFDEVRLASVRASGIVGVIRHILPDVAGIQEVDLHWYAQLDTGCLAPLGFIFPEVTPYPPSIALLYNIQKFKIVANGLIPFTDKWIRALNWAVLENLADGKRFIVANTHWALTVPKRMENAAMMAEGIQKLQAKYQCPVICFGDFNSYTDSAEFSLLLTRGDLKDAVATAKFTENKNINSWCLYQYSLLPRVGETHLDHVVYSGELTPLSARLVVDKALLDLSDHLPIVVDFKY